MYHRSFPLISRLASCAAHAVSSNYNSPLGISSGFDPIQRALEIVQTDRSKFSELEIDLIEAMATRSSAESKDAFNPAEMNFGEPYKLSPTAPGKAIVRVCSEQNEKHARHFLENVTAVERRNL